MHYGDSCFDHINNQITVGDKILKYPDISDLVSGDFNIDLINDSIHLIN